MGGEWGLNESNVRVVWVRYKCEGKYYCLGNTVALVEYIKGIWWCLGGVMW